MSYVWTIKDSAGRVVPNVMGASRLDVARKVVPTYHDAFRLHVSRSYRQIFDRELAKMLSQKCWRIARIRIRHSNFAIASCQRSAIGGMGTSDSETSRLVS